MNALTKNQAASREKTLLAALLLSMWAPLATGYAVVMSQSMTQVADFVRRSVELVALAISWWAFRWLGRTADLEEEQQARMERTANLSVAVALYVSGIVMVILSLVRISSYQPGGNVYPGLVIALLGLITNVWFWRRYTRLTHEQYSSIIDAQRQLYRAKSGVDVAVLVALAAVAIAPAHPVTRYVDVLGSLAVAGYLLWIGMRAARTAMNQAPVSGLVASEE